MTAEQSSYAGLGLKRQITTRPIGLWKYNNKYADRKQVK